MQAIRTLIIARDMLVRAGLSAILSAEEALDIVGRSIGGEQTGSDIDIYRPDVALIEAGEPGIVDELHAINQAELPVVLLAQPHQAAGVLAHIGDLAHYALLHRDSDGETIMAALYAVMQGLVVLAPEVAALLRRPVAGNAPPLLDALTPREIEVLALLAEGLANKAIGEQLSISTNTVKFHVNAILSKLDAHSRTEAVVRATQLGLIFV